MKLYVCYSALKNLRWTPRPGGHPCGRAHHALKQAGHEFEVEAVGGLGLPPLDRTSGRRKVKELSGASWVPVLVTDDGAVIRESSRIIEWAEQNAPV